MARLDVLDVPETARRFSDELFSVQQVAPPKEHTPRSHNSFTGPTCPFCRQQIAHHRISIWSQFASGVRRLFGAIMMIAIATCRCLRFVVGSGFCLLGLIGYCFRAIGLRIVHPQDRRLWERYGTSTVRRDLASLRNIR